MTETKKLSERLPLDDVENTVYNSNYSGVFKFLVHCRQTRVSDQTTSLNLRLSRQPTVLNRNPDSHFRRLIANPSNQPEPSSWALPYSMTF
ncbi:unnamed protein product [Schistocephalus solidus]|uniref:Uncharacterized protein n=1 Tax=Schistocephalus solidus TaxID=70667 RepID=A0A183T0N2_SCHSO|nr:unnamed protein product [Schistocephalus solidus]